MESSNQSYFAPDYTTARQAFLAAARRRGAKIETHAIGARGPGNSELAIDTAYLGAERPRRLLMVLSGTHGVEGYAGSAIQTQWLDNSETATLPPSDGCLLIHAVNPYGFAWLRRANEHNVDLNRNALDHFPGPSNPAYGELDGWLNPAAPPRTIDAFLPRGAWLLARHGLGPLRQAIARGQYDYPRGLFFGGTKREESIAHLERIVTSDNYRDAERVIVIDLHTGLGKSASYRMLIDVPAEATAFRDLARWFGADRVASSQQRGDAVYEVSGGIVEMIERRFAPARATVAVLEIGTVPLPQMLHRLHRENRATFYSRPDDPLVARERAALLRAFCPVSAKWRGRVLEHGRRVFTRALLAVSESPPG